MKMMNAKNNYFGCASVNCGELNPELGKKRFYYVCYFDYSKQNPNEPIMILNYKLADQYCTQCPTHKPFCDNTLCCKLFQDFKARIDSKDFRLILNLFHHRIIHIKQVYILGETGTPVTIGKTVNH